MNINLASHPIQLLHNAIRPIPLMPWGQHRTAVMRALRVHTEAIPADLVQQRLQQLGLARLVEDQTE